MRYVFAPHVRFSSRGLFLSVSLSFWHCVLRFSLIVFRASIVALALPVFVNFLLFPLLLVSVVFVGSFVLFVFPYMFSLHSLRFSYDSLFVLRTYRNLQEVMVEEITRSHIFLLCRDRYARAKKGKGGRSGHPRATKRPTPGVRRDDFEACGFP